MFCSICLGFPGGRYKDQCSGMWCQTVLYGGANVLEASCSSEMVIPTYQIIRHYTADDSNLQGHLHKNLKHNIDFSAHIIFRQDLQGKSNQLHALHCVILHLTNTYPRIKQRLLSTNAFICTISAPEDISETSLTSIIKIHNTPLYG
jgi:hypothetical protein